MYYILFKKPGVAYLVQQLPQASCYQITGRVQLGCAQHCRRALLSAWRGSQDGFLDLADRMGIEPWDRR